MGHAIYAMQNAVDVFDIISIDIDHFDTHAWEKQSWITVLPNAFEQTTILGSQETVFRKWVIRDLFGRHWRMVDAIDAVVCNHFSGIGTSISKGSVARYRDW